MTYLTIELATEQGNVCAVWHGGAYIDLGSTLDGPFTASDVINVWDYDLDRPRIPFTFDALVSAVLRHIREDDPLLTPEAVQIGRDGETLARYTWAVWLNPALAT